MGKEIRPRVSRSNPHYGEMGSNPHRKRRGKKRGVKGGRQRRKSLR